MLMYFTCLRIVALLICLLWSDPAWAGALTQRLADFPDWQKPSVQAAIGDLAYPTWFAGTWEMTSTLVDMVAPLAPDLVTPGFESNRQYLNQPIPCQVRFVPASALPDTIAAFPPIPKPLTDAPIVSDRAFNGLNLARAYLGDRAVIDVTVDPVNPNRQVTTLEGNRQLVSVVSGRVIEAPTDNRFLTTELFQQVFRGSAQPYLNQVETTTDYRLSATGTITADQITAIFLSPQDPQYFKAGDRPVALYRYRLRLKANQKTKVDAQP